MYTQKDFKEGSVAVCINGKTKMFNQLLEHCNINVKNVIDPYSTVIMTNGMITYVNKELFLDKPVVNIENIFLTTSQGNTTVVEKLSPKSEYSQEYKDFVKKLFIEQLTKTSFSVNASLAFALEAADHLKKNNIID